MKRMTQGILVLLVLFISLSSFALIQNDVPWGDPPGFFRRLLVYVSQNVAETSDDASFPELRTRTYDHPVSVYLDLLPAHMAHMGWQVQGIDRDAMTIDAVVSTPLLGFKDDLHIRLEPASKEQTRLHVRSASRFGRADYAANLGHILRLYQEIDLSSDLK